MKKGYYRFSNYRHIQEKVMRSLDRDEYDYYIGDQLYNGKLLISYRGYNAFLIPEDRFYLNKNIFPRKFPTEIIKDKVDLVSKNPTKLYYTGEKIYQLDENRYLYKFTHDNDDLITYLDTKLTKDLFDIGQSNIELFTLKDSYIEPVLVFDNKQFIGAICPVYCKD